MSMAGNGTPFELVHTSKVTEALLAIAQKAQGLGILVAVKEQLLAIMAKLLRDPENCGDPLHETVKPGGMVYRGFFSPFVVRYTVLAKERIVLLWDLHVIPDHPLA
jgi:hypothetical protein